MLNALKGLVSSKKFWTAVITGALTAGLNVAGVSADIQHYILGLGAVLLGTQGLTDFGKAAK